MKKTTVAALLGALSSIAAAQSSVTIFGVIDATVQHAGQAGAHVNRVNGVGGNQFSRLGFRGIEDLGGGLSAGFTLDAGLNVDDGTGSVASTNNQAGPASGTPLTAGGSANARALNGTGLVFSRRSTVSLMSRQWGELRVGRDFVPTYWNLTQFDPFGTAGSGSVNNLAQGALTRVSTVTTAIRASNSVGYFLPSVAGLYGQAMYALGENASNSAGGTRDDGRYAGLRLGYVAGALNVAASHGKTTLVSGDVSTTNLGASYELVAAKLMAQYFKDRNEIVAAPSSSRGWLLGAQVNVGSDYVPISYTTVRDNTPVPRSARQLAVGYVHNFSKRTAVYTTYSKIRNKDGAALTGGGVTGVANQPWTGLDLGIRHAF